MAKDILSLSLGGVGAVAERGKQYYADGHVFIAMNAQDFGLKHLAIQQPYRVEEGRVMAVTQGWVRVVINLEEVVMREQTLVVLVPGGIFEVLEWSEDFDMQSFAFKDLPLFTSLDSQVVLSLTADEWQLVGRYFQLMWHETHLEPLITEVFTHLQTALLLELSRIADRQEALRQHSASRQDTLFYSFLALVSKHGAKERKADFYAEQLHVTPSYLGSVVRAVSGLTVMQWVHRHVIQEAKLLLHYSDLPIWDVSEQLAFANPSFFSKFFKQHTGMKPGEYRSLR